MKKSDWGNEEDKSRTNENIGQIEEMNDSLDDTENEENSDNHNEIPEAIVIQESSKQIGTTSTAENITVTSNNDSENDQLRIKIREIISERLSEFEMESNFSDFLDKSVTNPAGCVGIFQNITIKELRTLFEPDLWVEDSVIDFYANLCLLNGAQVKRCIFSGQYMHCVSYTLLFKST